MKDLWLVWIRGGWEMAIAAPGQLNVSESPSWGSRSVDCFEKLEQVGEGTYGSALAFSLFTSIMDLGLI